MCESLIQLQALVDVVIAAHANGETDAEFLARLDEQDAAEQARLAAEYPTDDEDPEERSTFYVV
jgi:hypothetical protein